MFISSLQNNLIMFSLEKPFEEMAIRYASTFFSVARQCLKPVKSEHVLIITDYGSPSHNVALMMARAYYLGLQQKGYNVHLAIQEEKKGFMHVDEHVRNALERLPPKSVVIVCVSNKLGRFGEKRSFRKFCKENGHRFGSASGLKDARNSQFELFVEAMNVNYVRMQKKGRLIKKLLDKGKQIRVWTEAGTELLIDIEGMQAISNDGNYNESGRGGNLPAGEVYIAPKGSRGVNGKLVIDGSLRHEKGSTLISSPVVLEIKEGRIVSVVGDQAQLLLETFETFEARAKYPERVRLIGEFGIGINSNANLMGVALMDEKVEGTAHIGIGSNSWFGGEIKTIFHGDQTFKDPVIYIDGKKLEF
jgi:aminopeptidase